MRTPTEYTAGQIVTCAQAFTSPIGAWFRAGHAFVVEIGGPTAGRSIKLRSTICGSVVWISDGLFLTK